MKAVTSWFVVLIMGVLTGAGCEANSSIAAKVGPARPLVFYDETGDPSDKAPVLSDAEVREITEAIAARTDDPIWLIRVKPSLPDGARGGRVVYMVPERQTPRIRTGLAYSIPVLGERGGIPAPWKYVQVSKAGEAFTAQFTRPSIIDLPFRWPEMASPKAAKANAVPASEVVRIVDFIREPLNYEDLPGQDTPMKQQVARNAQKLPIFSIIKQSDMIDVESGYLHTASWGWGIKVTVMCTKDGYAITAWGTWVVRNGQDGPPRMDWEPPYVLMLDPGKGQL